MIILDFGSGETCHNDFTIVKRMIDALDEVNTGRHRVIIKWQLFTKVPADCKPLGWGVFERAYQYALGKSYFTTASVFDEDSLRFLVNYSTPFIKIACRPPLYHLLDLISPEKKVFVSIGPGFNKETITAEYENVTPLYCVPEYPASATVYETAFGGNLSYSISDHTTDWYLYRKYQPYFYECHYKLEDSNGLDSGPFARTPAQLEEIL